MVAKIEGESWQKKLAGERGLPPSSVLQGWRSVEPLPLSGSERRLFRLLKKTDKPASPASSAILIDARKEANLPAHAPYLQRLQELTSFLTRTGLHVPRIEALDHTHSLAVVEDLGENSYARALGSRGIEACQPLFQRALDDLIRLSKTDARDAPKVLPAFDEERFVEQTMPFADVFLTKEQPLVWQELWRELYRNAAFDKQELAPVLGDVHIENIFVRGNNNPDSNEDGHSERLGERHSERLGEQWDEECVFIDFQDAHIAPRCYDVVSLLEDGLWSMPAVQREELWGCYERAYAGCGDISAAQHYALCALHRELRMIGILYRLSRIRGKGRYGGWLATTVRRCRRRLAEQGCFANLREFLKREIGFEKEGWIQRGLDTKRKSKDDGIRE